MTSTEVDIEPGFLDDQTLELTCNLLLGLEEKLRDSSRARLELFNSLLDLANNIKSRVSKYLPA